MKKTLLKSTLLLLFLFIFSTSHSQTEEIFLLNPSFEDLARPGVTPEGWFDCGRINFPNETPPDVHPAEGKHSAFGVTKKASHGQTYLGMVVRQNGSFESVAQELTTPLEGENCYGFKISLCKSKFYKSFIRGTQGKQIGFITPVLLRIWGGNNFCDKGELLAESELIENTEWMDYTFKLKPSKDYNHIILEAYYKTFTDIPPNGNLMLDNASSFLLVDCDHEGELNFTENKYPTINNQIIVPDFLERTKGAIRKRNVTGTEQNVTSPIQLKMAINTEGRFIKFYKNELTVPGIERLQYLGSLLPSFPQYKLIIDLNGMKKKKAKLRMMQIENVLLKKGLTTEEFEVRNTNYDDEKVEWIVEKGDLCIGLLVKE